MKLVDFISYPARPVRRIGLGQCAAFTLVELLVVIGIIALLVSLLLPAISYARKQAYVSRTKLDIRTIEAALDAYKEDFGDVPRWPTNLAYTTASTSTLGVVMGSQLLGLALLSPGPADEDGANGFGFRVRQQPKGGPYSGKVYGPYLEPGKFKTQTFPTGYTNPTTFYQTNGYQILDNRPPTSQYPNGMPFLYLPHSLTQPDVSQGVSPQGTPIYAFDVGQMINANSQCIYALAPGDAPYFTPKGSPNNTIDCQSVQIVLGDINYDGIIESNETPVSTTAPFLIWDAGFDGVFGFPNAVSSPPSDPQHMKQYLQTCDDILNVPWAYQQ